MKTAIVSTAAGTWASTLARVVRVAALPLAMVTLPALASAQRGGQRELFEWRGNVDQEIRIQMRGGRTSVMDMGPREMTGYNQARATSAVPAAPGYVSVQVMQGRGRADVVQQPTAQNGYTTVVRVRDPQGGAGAYDIAAIWQPTGNTTYGTYGTYGTRSYPVGGTVQQPVYQGGKQLPGTTQQNTGTVYGNYPYPNSTVYPRTTPNGKVLPSGAQQAHARDYDKYNRYNKYDKHTKHDDHDDHDGRD